MNIPHHIYLKLQKQAEHEVLFFEDDLSDIDMAYNPVTDKYDIPAVEWDGMYGKHWQRFESEAERTACLQEHATRHNNAITAATKKLVDIWKAKRIAAEAAKPTLANLFPDVFLKLKTI